MTTLASWPAKPGILRHLTQKEDAAKLVTLLKTVSDRPIGGLAHVFR